MTNYTFFIRNYNFFVRNYVTILLFNLSHRLGTSVNYTVVLLMALSIIHKFITFMNLMYMLRAWFGFILLTYICYLMRYKQSLVILRRKNVKDSNNHLLVIIKCFTLNLFLSIMSVTFYYSFNRSQIV